MVERIEKVDADVELSDKHDKATVLPKELGGGPHGLGDPNDRKLRKVELEVMVAMKIRDKSKMKCALETKAFKECCRSAGFSMVVKCRKETSALKSCLEHCYKDEMLKKECIEEYLLERSEYRRTGVKKKRSAIL